MKVIANMEEVKETHLVALHTHELNAWKKLYDALHSVAGTTVTYGNQWVADSGAVGFLETLCLALKYASQSETGRFSITVMKDAEAKEK